MSLPALPRPGSKRRHDTRRTDTGTLREGGLRMANAFVWTPPGWWIALFPEIERSIFAGGLLLVYFVFFWGHTALLHAFDRFGWFRRFKIQQGKAPPTALVREATLQLPRIDRQRVCITGASMGAFASLELELPLGGLRDPAIENRCGKMFCSFGNELAP